MGRLRDYFAADRRTHDQASAMNPNHILVSSNWVDPMPTIGEIEDAPAPNDDPGAGLFDPDPVDDEGER